MSNELPGIDARMSAQERLQTILHARIEEVAQDMHTNFRQLIEYHRQNKREMDARFDKSDAFMKAVAQDVHDSFDQLDKYLLETEQKTDGRLDKIEARMATKDDIASIKEDMVALEGRLHGDMHTMEGRLHGDMRAMEDRILDAFKQLVIEVERRLPPPRASKRS